MASKAHDGNSYKTSLPTYHEPDDDDSKVVAMSLRRWPTLLAFVASLFVVFLTWPANASQPVVVNDPPRHSTGLTDAVQWDNYTLWIEGQRVFLHSGEFHTFRLPVRELWLDVFQKMAAAGLNAASVYVHQGLSNPSPTTLSFDGVRDLQPVFAAAAEAGLFIVLRPGPYINAETTAGGVALWATSTIAGELRTNDTGVRESWELYINGIINEVSHDYLPRLFQLINV